MMDDVLAIKAPKVEYVQHTTCSSQSLTDPRFQRSYAVFRCRLSSMDRVVSRIWFRAKRKRRGLVLHAVLRTSHLTVSDDIAVLSEADLLTLGTDRPVNMWFHGTWMSVTLIRTQGDMWNRRGDERLKITQVSE